MMMIVFLTHTGHDNTEYYLSINHDNYPVLSEYYLSINPANYPVLSEYYLTVNHANYPVAVTLLVHDLQYWYFRQQATKLTNTGRGYTTLYFVGNAKVMKRILFS